MNETELKCLRGHKSDVLCCQCSTDDRLLCSASVDSTVKVRSPTLCQSLPLLRTFSLVCFDEEVCLMMFRHKSNEKIFNGNRL